MHNQLLHEKTSDWIQRLIPMLTGKARASVRSQPDEVEHIARRHLER